MFAIFEKIFRANRVALIATSPASPKIDLYSVVAPVWRVDDRHGVYRGLSGDAIAIVNNHAQAETLRDVLNLADGRKPSRRLLDAINGGETAPFESDTTPGV